MIDCPLEKHELGWTCPLCGWVYRHLSEKPPRRNCPKARKKPSFAKKLTSWSKATRRWIKAGRPRRGHDEVQQIYAETCCPCSDLDKTTKSCKICGCKVRASGFALMNKIKMATESCPLGKW